MTAIGAAGPVLAALASEEPRDWQAFAACAETDPEAFFPAKGAPTAPAKAVCARCFVRQDCLAYALANPELTSFGIWGGTSERQRRRLRKERAA